MVYDWIVIGNGITGAAVSYELAKQGAAVLLLEQSTELRSATRHSYGGIAYWSGTTPVMRQLCEEGIGLHRQFFDELEYDTEFRDLDLLLTIPSRLNSDELNRIVQTYASCAIPPKLLSREDAAELEPLLNKDAIAAALTVHHGHVHPEKMVHAYNHAFKRHNGVMHVGTVVSLLQDNGRVTGVATPIDQFDGNHVVVCTGGWSRHLLHTAGIRVQQCFTHAESIEMSDPGVRLNTIVMPAALKRFNLEDQAGDPSHNDQWDQPGQELAPHILDAGAIQFCDGQIRVGQISRVLTDPFAVVDAEQSEHDIRNKVGDILPLLQSKAGRWCHCLVSFSGDRLPLIGPVPHWQGLSLFSGFGNPFAIVPPLARRFASDMMLKGDRADPILQQMALDRPTLSPQKP